MNRTDQWSDEELRQAVKNLNGVLGILIPMRDAIGPREEMFNHFHCVIEFIKEQKKQTMDLLTGQDG